MRRITKDEAPTFWTTFVKSNPRINYSMLENSEDGRDLKKRIRAHMLHQQLYLCGYCCKIINADNAHNEHIYPQKTYPKLSMDYNNLIVSCTTQGDDATCGMRKLGEYDQALFVSPLAEDCEQHFRFLDDGRIDGITPAGDYTVRLLNLNSYALTSARLALLKEIDSTIKYCGLEYVKEYYLEPQDGQLPRFVDMTTYFMQQGRFDTISE